MVKFDLILAAGKAYQTSWLERRYLLRLAILPFVIKAFCYMLAFAMGHQDDHIALTLFLVPAFFLEGWMLSHYVRLLMLGHRWPFRPTGDLQDDLPVLRMRARGIMAGTISYVLINMAMGGIMALLMTFVPMLDVSAENYDPSTASPSIGLLMMFLLVALIWAFRFVWLFVPLAANINAGFYLKSLKGYLSSFPLIGVWLVCIVPFFMAMRFVGGMLHEVLKAGVGEDVASFALVILMVAMDTIKNIVATAGITYAVMEIFEKQGKVDFRA